MLGHSSQVISHDPSGRPLEAIDANLPHTRLHYDVRGRLIQSSSFPDGETEANGRRSYYSYTPAGDIANYCELLGHPPKTGLTGVVLSN